MGLWLNDRATDADLRYLKNIKRLRQLSLYGTQVTDAGLVHLKDLRPLEALDLTNTQVTDAGLVHVKEVKSLRRLDLVNTRVTDAGLVHLAALRDRFPLELNLRGTRATAAGVEKLRAALPDADIRGP